MVVIMMCRVVIFGRYVPVFVMTSILADLASVLAANGTNPFCYRGAYISEGHPLLP